MSTGPNPSLTRETARELDRLALSEYSIPSIVLMENAGSAVARAAMRLHGDRAGANALVVCGPGNNGGDGLVVARHLHNAGMKVVILFCAEPGRAKGDALTNLVIVGRMALPMRSATGAMMAGAFDECVRLFGGGGVHFVIDALFGTGLTRGLDGDFEAVVARISRARASGARVVAVDTPSGLDADTGTALGPAVHADVTVTFGAWKVGFARAGAADYTGLIEVGDLGVPRELVDRLARLTSAR